MKTLIARFALTVILCLCLAGGHSNAQEKGRAPDNPTNRLTLPKVVRGAVGPFDLYCDGYGNPGASGVGYISVLKLETGKVRKDTDELLEGIVSYDRAETLGTYIGQINMITASSFNGINGAVWGYHLAKADSIADGSLKPLFKKRRSDGVEIPVYPVEPLLDAGRRLFGTNENRRFPLLPGAHVICANKSCTIKGPTSVWSAIALAIAEDRQKDSNLFIEDCGHSIPAENDEARRAYLDRLMRNIAESIVRCGDDSNVKYKEIFVGYKTEWVPEGYVGCALVCAPYVVLAKKAIPAGATADRLLGMTLSGWEQAVGLPQAK
ncbi:MAG: histidine decarboxylase [Planctomycetes bacterium]|nr:histidine decarboxylase [Planctomycetota bacterium]